MAEVKWIKMATNIFDNRKIKQIESLPEGDAIIVIWIKLLCLAGNTNDSGMIYLTEEIPYTEQMLSTQFNRPLNVIQMAMKVFEQFGMIEVIDDILRISNWEKYQNVEGMEKVREQNRVRKRNQRAREKLLLEDNHVTCHVTSHQCHAIDIDIDKELDIDIEKDINNICSSKDERKPKHYTEEPEYQDFLKIYDIYPKKQGKQSAYANYKKWISKSGKDVNGIKYHLTNEQIWEAVNNYVNYNKKHDTQLQYYMMFSTLMNNLLDWTDEYGEETN